MTADEELVKRLWDRWNEGIRTFEPELLDPEIEIHSALTRTAWNGEQGVTAWAAEIDDQFEQWEVSAAEIQTLADGLVLIRGAIRARGRGSGMDLDQPAVWVVELRDGRVRRIRNFIGHDSAERAAAEAGAGSS